MARKMAEWHPKHRPITKIMRPDGVKRNTAPLALGLWYNFHEVGGYLGNVGLERPSTTDHSSLAGVSGAGAGVVQFGLVAFRSSVCLCRWRGGNVVQSVTVGGEHPAGEKEFMGVFYGNFRDPADGEFLDEAIARFRKMFGNVFAADNVILFKRNLGYRRNEQFMEAFRANATTDQEKSLELRLNTLIWAAEHALQIDGDLIECGVWRGFCSAVVAQYLNFENIPKNFYLYDTFDGIPEEYDSEKHDSPAFAEPGLYEKVVARFQIYPNVRIIKGVVPDSFEQAVPEKISFLHLDMNSSKSEIAALEVLFDRVTPGGLIVFDDYGWTGYRAQQLAEDAFMAKRGYKILELPTGQGLLIKR